MGHYQARVEWARGTAAFVDNKYSRAHRWHFDGGIEVPASSSPQVVALPYSSAEAVDPEEAFVASLSSCHMLWFLSLTASAGFIVDRYDDAAVGVLAKDAGGRLAMTEVLLRPSVTFASGGAPSAERFAQLHHAAHEACFLANSVRTTMRCEPTMQPATAN